MNLNAFNQFLDSVIADVGKSLCVEQSTEAKIAYVRALMVAREDDMDKLTRFYSNMLGTYEYFKQDV